MAKRILLYGFLLIALMAGIFYRDDLESYFLRSSRLIGEFTAKSIDGLLEDLPKEISTPEPLKSSREEQGADLTKAGVIKFTNAERKKQGLSAFKENAKLNEAALKKANDMFAKQYFAHVSPAGKGPQDLAEAANYDYLTIGENLALGNFAGDEDLVAAWMASLGHRENILRKNFSEIGIAVVEGTYEGQKTWMAVQEFGTPASACPKVDEKTRTQIESNKQEIDSLEKDISRQKKELENAKTEVAYLQALEKYNALVARHNSLVDKTKNVIDNYNRQVKIRNGCLSGFSQS